jgi:NADH:ubiquinone oxidoreductase subunit 2 (subunit N)
MFGGAFVVDPYSIALTGFFLAAAYVTLLLSVDYIGEGDYYQGEFYFLLLTSVLGMIVMASARDLITIFVALEAISIPTFVLAGWRKHDTKSNEAASILCLVGSVNLPIIKFSVDWWNTLHQPSSILRADGPAIDSSMLVPVLVMFGAFLCYFVVVHILRTRAELTERKIRNLRLSTDHPTA